VDAVASRPSPDTLITPGLPDADPARAKRRTGETTEELLKLVATVAMKAASKGSRRMPG
jgi:hypothetical protein